MTDTAWAEQTARNLLSEPLPAPLGARPGRRRDRADTRPVLGPDTDLVTAAAWLHDIGYAPALADTGFHPLDGARYLRDTEHADAELCSLVAYHSGAINEAAERGLAGELTREFRPARRDLSDALIYCDMTTGPDGQRTTVEQRLAEIQARYGPEDPVSHAIARSAPLLTTAVTRLTRRLARCTTPAPASRRPGLPCLADIGLSGARRNAPPAAASTGPSCTRRLPPPEPSGPARSHRWASAPRPSRGR